MKTAARRAALLLALGALFAGLGLEAQQAQDESAPAAGEANTAAPPKPMRSRVSPGVAAGLLRKRVAPEYPQKARDNRSQGTVVLKARISTEGEVAGLWVAAGGAAWAAAAIEGGMQAATEAGQLSWWRV